MARILVVDDDEQVRTMLRLTLEGAGYETEDAPDGRSAMHLQERKPADLVITDIMMPDKDGLETILDLRRQWPEAKIIAISGGGRVIPHDYLDHAKLLGAEKVFTKPIEREELLTAIRELLGEE